MKPSERLADAVRAASKRGEPAIVAFMTAGFPRKEQFREHLLAVASESDVVEIGVPFTDPMADGMTIQRSSQAALKQGVSLKWILSELRSMQRPATPLVLMSYLNRCCSMDMPHWLPMPQRQASADSSCRICPLMRASNCVQH